MKAPLNFSSKVNASFNSIKSTYIFQAFYAALFLGLPFYPPTSMEKDSQLPLVIRTWCFSQCSVKAIIYFFFLITGAVYIPYKVTVFTFYTLSCFTASLTFYMIRYRHSITDAIRKLCEMAHCITPSPKTGSKFCILQIIILALCFSYSAVCFKKGLDSLHYSTTFSMMGFDLFQAYRISVITVFLNAITTTGITIIICTNLFVTLRHIIRSFREKLGKRYRIRNYSKKNILEDITMFRKIASSYQKLEESLSPMLFFVSVLCIVTFLNSLSILLTRQLSPLSAVSVFVNMSEALIPFVYLTNSASSVISEYNLLKECLIRCSGDIAMATSSVSDISLFIVLSDNIRSTSFQFSAGRMFIIDKALILTVGGLIVTYGVIEYQMNTFH